MSIFLQLLINGLIAGAIYSFIASGFSLIYSVNRFIHFAHGIVCVFAGYFLYFLFASLGINFIISAILAVILAIILGLLMNTLVYKTLRKRKASNVILLIASLALWIFFESLILLLFGADIKTIGLIKTTQGINLLGAIITPLQIVILIISVTFLLAFWLLMKHTKIGKAMRAVSDNKEAAAIVGINLERIYNWSFIMGSGAVAIGGVLIALEQNLEPTMGTPLMIKGFTGAIIGGLGSVPGAILGSFLLGLSENFGIWWLPSGYKDAIAFGILFIFLLFRPQGIFGVKK